MHVEAQLLDLFGRTDEAVGHHRTGLITVGGNFRPAHYRRPQRLHERAVDAGEQEDLVVDLAQGLQVFGIVDVAALGIADHDAHRVAQAAQGVCVLDIVAHELLGLRHHVFEAGLDLQAGRKEAED
ncbi:hypothetical protein D3C75_993970 [compost metagenome]